MQRLRWHNYHDHNWIGKDARAGMTSASIAQYGNLLAKWSNCVGKSTEEQDPCWTIGEDFFREIALKNRGWSYNTQDQLSMIAWGCLRFALSFVEYLECLSDLSLCKWNFINFFLKLKILVV